MEQYYTAGTVMALLQTDYVTLITRQALEERMAYAGKAPYSLMLLLLKFFPLCVIGWLHRILKTGS